jgi:hypothetical protein
MWTLILNGWRHWNREAKFSGQSVGARIRRWWWGVNKWTLPTERKSRLSDRKMARNVSEVSAAFLEVGSPIHHLLRLHADSWDSIIRASSRVRRRIRRDVVYCKSCCTAYSFQHIVCPQVTLFREHLRHAFFLSIVLRFSSVIRDTLLLSPDVDRFLSVDCISLFPSIVFRSHQGIRNPLRDHPSRSP